MPEKEIIIEIALERLRDFPGSPFSVVMDEPMQDLIDSIRIYGILNPLIVRPMPDGCYGITDCSVALVNAVNVDVKSMTKNALKEEVTYDVTGMSKKQKKEASWNIHTQI